MPLQTYVGEQFTIGYPQNWHVTGPGNDININPQYNGINGFVETDGYMSSALNIATEKATSNTPPNAGLDFLKAWEQHQSNYKLAPMPGTIIIEGNKWFQQAVLSETQAVDSLSTVHVAKDGSMLLFTITFVTDAGTFNCMNSQVLQRMWSSFTFR